VLSSTDERQIATLADAGIAHQVIAVAFGCSRGTVTRALRRQREARRELSLAELLAETGRPLDLAALAAEPAAPRRPPPPRRRRRAAWELAAERLDRLERDQLDGSVGDPP
jgi:hypothetical protein